MQSLIQMTVIKTFHNPLCVIFRLISFVKQIKYRLGGGMCILCLQFCWLTQCRLHTVQMQSRKETSLCYYYLQKKKKVSNICAEAGVLVLCRAVFANTASTDRWFRELLFGLNCFQAGGSSAAHLLVTQASSFCSMLHGCFQEPSYCACQSHLSGSCTTLKHSVLQIVISWLTTIKRISCICDICWVVSLAFGNGKAWN